jgi:hypothetical protein
VRARVGAALLVALGSLQMVGDLGGQPAIRAVGAATHASPAPKVFTVQSGFETFSSRFYVDWQDSFGTWHAFELTPANYRNVRGPYNRRNAYGAALAGAPILAGNPLTKPMLSQIARYGLCGNAPLLSELGVARDQVRYPLRIRLERREERSRVAGSQYEFWISC